MNVIQKSRYGVFLYNPRDAYIGKSLAEYGEFSKEESDLFTSILRPGDIALDVGANIGAHSIAMANAVGDKGLVYAFEPQRMCYYSLCANVAMNGLRQVICLQQAVSDKPGVMKIPELDFMKPGNFGGLEIYHEWNAPGTCQVKVVTVDAMNLPSLRFMKVDVEGMETAVLDGARETIQKFRPILNLECDRQDQFPYLIAMLRQMNYVLYIHCPPLYSSENYFKNEINYFGNIVSKNIFCYPAEQEPPVDLEKYKMVFLDPAAPSVTIVPSKKAKQELINDATTGVLQQLTGLANMHAELLYDMDNAIKYLDRAIDIDPENWSIWGMYSPIYTRFGRYDLGLPTVEKALELGGDKEKLYFNKAVCLDGVGRYEEANEIYKELISLKPEHVAAHCNMASNLLLLENYEEGWKEFEWRFHIDNAPLRGFMNALPKKIPIWDGHPLNGERVLLFIEQGVGDQIQFLRYIPFVKQMGGRVLLPCFKNMETILKSVADVEMLAIYDENAYIDESIEYDYMCSILSLPHLLKKYEIPWDGPYLKPVIDDSLFDLEPYSEKYKVGFAWCGNTIHKNDHTRSCHLKYFENLMHHQVQLFSLQKGKSERDWPSGPVDLLEGSENVDFVDWSDKFTDFNVTANLIEKLDLVITVDTSIAHLAGAMGKEVWLLVGLRPDWRWGNVKDTTPWYPNTRIFRGSWDQKFKDVKKALEQRLSKNNL
jgi:FkbM family methyltransferase